MDKRLERILPRVQKPARYVGGEFNAIMKDKSKVDTRIAFCFPDTYEIGMSNLGMRILYGVMNNMEGVWCERCYAPWGDMEEEMRKADMPLFALESGDPITDFDIVAFSVGYEMAFPAILNMLDLAGIPIHSAERTGLTPLVIGPGVKTGMDIKYDNPREVGADRIVNAVAAYEKFGGPVIIIDFGTATTFCAVDKKGTYLGGAICPGIGISTDALVQRTAKLPRIEVVRTDKVICRNTVESMQAGVFYGFVGQVDGIVARMRKELGCKAKVVATGGLAVIVAPATDAIDVVEPMLTLEGLRIIYDRNR